MKDYMEVENLVVCNNQEEGCVIVTAHANNRIKERMVGMKSAKRRYSLAMSAYQYGVRLADSNGAERAYLLHCKKSKSEYADRELVLYNDSVFVFANNFVVTVLPIDPKYRYYLQQNRCKKNKKRFTQSKQQDLVA